MELTQRDKRVLVTGGTRGIGRETALAFARAGADVVACYRIASEAVAKLDAELSGIGNRYRLIQADVTDPTDVEWLAATCRNLFGGLDVVVNNAGVDGQAPLDGLVLDEWRRVIGTNLTGPFLVIQATLPLLSDGGAIVNIGAALAARGMPGRSHYTASKAGLLGLSRSLSKELGGRRIRINTIEPGIVETEPGAGLPPVMYQGFCKANPLGRLAQPQEVAAAALFLGSDLARYINGSVITLDGGM